MSNYTPRKTAPSKTNKYFIADEKGGLNECILIDGNSCLPNCVGYAWGRVYEYLGTKPKLAKTNAENWYGYTKDGYKRTKTPKVGDVICWRKGQAGVSSDGAGHVAVVEEVYSDGSILTSNSDYGGRRFYLMKLKKGYAIKGLVFRGFIHIKDFETEKPVTAKYKFKKGQEVIVTGRGNTQANGKGIANGGVGFERVVLDILEGEAYPYRVGNSGGTLGFYKESELKASTGLNKGDKVKIVGVGKASANGTGANAYGIGWQRRILKVHTGKSYPYEVGNNSGTTGFYQANDLQKI